MSEPINICILLKGVWQGLAGRTGRWGDVDWALGLVSQATRRGVRCWGDQTGVFVSKLRLEVRVHLESR